MSAELGGFELAVDEERELGIPGRLTWQLPGHGDPGPSCGTFRHRAHEAARPLQWHFRRARFTCGRFACPTCTSERGGWADRESEAVARRLRVGAARARAAGYRSGVIHVVLSPPEGLRWKAKTLEGYLALRAEAYAVARTRGLDGGCLIFHHLRLGSARFNDGRSLGCREGLHWHFLGLGWVREARVCPDCTPGWISMACEKEQLLPRVSFPFHPEADWVVKNLGIRRSIRSTARYLLSHASQGILPCTDLSGGPKRPRGPEIVTWWGSMACSRFASPPPEAPDERCEVCDEFVPGQFWFNIVWSGSGPPPEEDVGTCESGQWRAERPGRERIECGLDVAP